MGQYDLAIAAGQLSFPFAMKEVLEQRRHSARSDQSYKCSSSTSVRTGQQGLAERKMADMLMSYSLRHLLFDNHMPVLFYKSFAGASITQAFTRQVVTGQSQAQAARGTQVFPMCSIYTTCKQYCNANAR